MVINILLHTEDWEHKVTVVLKNQKLEGWFWNLLPLLLYLLMAKLENHVPPIVTLHSPTYVLFYRIMNSQYKFLRFSMIFLWLLQV